MARKLNGHFDGRPMAALNVTPLVPVLLVLFAVFIVGAGADTPKAANDLQVAPALPPVDWVSRTSEAYVSIKSEGYFVDGQVVPSAELISRLHAIAQGKDAEGLSRQRIRVRADADVPYATFAGVIKAAKAEGLEVMLVNEDLH